MITHTTINQPISLLSKLAARLLLTVIACLFIGTGAYAQTTYTYIVPGTAGHNWVNTGINLRPGTLIQLSATGAVNVGGGLGVYGPEGTTAFVNASGYPAITPFRYGLVARITDSRTNPDDDVREDFSYGERREHCSSVRGRLWLTVNDYAPADNTGEFRVTVTIGTCTPGSTPLRRTRVHVTDDNGANVKDAEVYVNGVRLGVTNRDGNADFPPLPVGTQIIVRSRVHENRTYLNSHSAGSTQNWNYRVYTTNLAVNNDGSLSGFTISDPLAVQEVRVRRVNAMVGLHLVASVEWDATTAEMENIRNQLIGASQFLYNATDGQFFIEQVELADNEVFWNDCDYRIFTDWSLRANAYRNNFHGAGAGGNAHINMSRRNGAYVYAHEFGHYGFDLDDEYTDDGREFCTLNVPSLTSMFGWTDSSLGTNLQPRASCMMWNTAPKLCSNHADNLHARNTRQGAEDCWTHIINKFRDAERGPFTARWAFNTPTTRGVIVGSLPAMPIADWVTRVTITNRNQPGLCGPVEVLVTRADNGQPLGDVEVFNRTASGREFLQGKSRTDDPSTPEDETGRITVTGVHLGDRIRVNGGSLTVTDCVLTARAGQPSQQLRYVSAPAVGSLRPATLTAADGFTLLRASAAQDSVQRLEVTPEPFEVYVQVEPAAARSAVIRVRASAALKDAPQVALTLTGAAKTQNVAMSFDPATGSYTGRVKRLPLYAQARIEVTAVGESEQTVTRLHNVVIAPVDPKGATDMFSANGQLSVTISASGLPAAAQVVIGPADAPPPVLEDRVVVSGPFNLSVSAADELGKPSVIRFQLPQRPNPQDTTQYDGVSAYDPQSFEIRRYSRDRQEWEAVGGTFIPEVAVVTLPISQPGAYVLTARPLAGKPAGPEKKLVAFASSLGAQSR